MLVLGGEILLGFQLRAPFEPLFPELASSTRALHAVSLILIAMVVGLLIAPAIHHRQLDEGHYSWR